MKKLLMGLILAAQIFSLSAHDVTPKMADFKHAAESLNLHELGQLKTLLGVQRDLMDVLMELLRSIQSQEDQNRFLECKEQLDNRIKSITPESAPKVYEIITLLDDAILPIVQRNPQDLDGQIEALQELRNIFATALQQLS